MAVAADVGFERRDPADGSDEAIGLLSYERDRALLDAVDDGGF